MNEIRNRPNSVSAISLLPADLANRSLSEREIVLTLADAERAIEHLNKTGQRLEAWEGWVRFTDGTRTHSLRHPGSFVLPNDAARAAEVTLESIRKAQSVWDRAPEYPGAALYFCLTVASA
ncbi:MAG TPA: hypothetical protein VGH98_08060 [Gemmatimonadaceae bacterium]|jgi:hypothetical protein